MTLTKTDLLVVQRGDTAYKTDFENLRDSVIDGLDISHRISIIADEDGQRTFYYYDENFTPDKVQVYLTVFSLMKAYMKFKQKKFSLMLVLKR